MTTKILSVGLTAIALLAPIGCGKVYNSSSYDATTYGVSTGSAQFLAAKEIIVAKCASCHTRPSHAAWAGTSEEEYISQGLIKAQDLEGSVLYTKIQGNRTAIAGNMPFGGTPLTDAELDTMEAWINSITP
ncbi:hypothetical protein [Bdellovibrio sp. HCB337]|uniref:hypothetical protein n=1 Tax=Bdellovibrio sp. HCB337 TaxID=3394358 RepID=UPI0039A7296B